MITLANWRERMSEDMRLRAFRPRTQEAYLLVVRQLMDYMQRGRCSVAFVIRCGGRR
jgi:hypothetical protein